MKKFETLNEVAQAREEGQAKVFNIQAALNAALSVPVKVRAGGGSQLNSNIIELMSVAPGELSVQQIKAALIAGGVAEDDAQLNNKNLASRLFVLAKQGRIARGAAKGMYTKVAQG